MTGVPIHLVVDIGSPRLLARLDLEALLGGVGSYTLGVVGLNSSFTDDTFTPFTFNSPSININVTAVPEPSSIGGAAALALGACTFEEGVASWFNVDPGFPSRAFCKLKDRNKICRAESPLHAVQSKDIYE